jgi:dTDP-4-dehydrorhamnose reductase
VDQRKWLVTGANGFLGANAGLFLKNKNVVSAGLTRGGDATYFNETTHAELENPGELTPAILKSKPNVILHCAAISSHEDCELNPELAMRVNAEATKEVAQAAAQIGAQLIYISTDSAFSGEKGDYKETDLAEPFSVYGKTKLLGEQYAQDFTDALIIRTNFFGWSPDGSRSILEFFYSNLKLGNPIRGFTNVTTTSLYVPTLLDYLWQLAAKNHTGVFHVTSRDSQTKYEFGQQVAHTWNFDPGNMSAELRDQPRDISLNTDKLATTLNTTVQSQLEGIEIAQHDFGTFQP